MGVDEGGNIGFEFRVAAVDAEMYLLAPHGRVSGNRQRQLSLQVQFQDSKKETVGNTSIDATSAPSTRAAPAPGRVGLARAGRPGQPL